MKVEITKSNNLLEIILKGNLIENTKDELLKYLPAVKNNIKKIIFDCKDLKSIDNEGVIALFEFYKKLPKENVQIINLTKKTFKDISNTNLDELLTIIM